MKIVEESKNKLVLRAGSGLGSGTTATFDADSALLTLKSGGPIRAKTTKIQLSEVGGAYLESKGTGTSEESAVAILVQAGDDLELTPLATGGKKEKEQAVQAINRFLGITPLEVTAQRRVLEVEQFVNILVDNEGKDPWILQTIMQRLVEIGQPAVAPLEEALQVAGGQGREYIEQTLQQIDQRR